MNEAGSASSYLLRRWTAPDQRQKLGAWQVAVFAAFKAFCNRSKDWADLEEMHAARSLDIEVVLGVLVKYLGADDERVERLRSLWP